MQHNYCKGVVAETVLQHHERWKGNGYPRKLKGKDIAQFAQIIAITDTYVSLLSKRPGKQMFMPHQAVEYIMAQSEDQFNPELVEMFVREIPCYPTGLTIRLNTKEMAIVSDAKLGFIARPKVRVVYDEEQGQIRKPYDIDLSKMEYQSKLITEVIDYF
jgi:HD-GYP domain-containing protein (c-di-GMP phosphodiesterase class II)